MNDSHRGAEGISKDPPWLSALEAVPDAPSRVDLVRYHMYRAMGSTLESLAPSGIGLAVSDWKPVLPGFMPGVTFYGLAWPRHDIQNLDQVPDASVDVILSDMVLEHVPDPRAAMSESHRVLKPGGLAIHTSVFTMPHHPSPRDYWRFSPDGWRHLAADFSRVHQAAGFGNRRALLMVLARLTRIQSRYRRPSPLALPLWGNNSKYPICTWLIAEK